MDKKFDSEKRDLILIAGLFASYQIPKEKRYLLKYFTSPVQLAFLKYFLVTGTVFNFVDHTGHYCSERLLYRLRKRYVDVTRIYDEAKASLTEKGMKFVHLIESGRLMLTKFKDWSK